LIQSQIFDTCTCLEIIKHCSEMVNAIVYEVAISPLILDYNFLRIFYFVWMEYFGSQSLSLLFTLISSHDNDYMWGSDW
jgi:hypothetical protein